jgi:hypothetical protein
MPRVGGQPVTVRERRATLLAVNPVEIESRTSCYPAKAGTDGARRDAGAGGAALSEAAKPSE